MSNALKYMVDENGDKTSVVVPLKTWERINNEYAGLQKKLKVLTGIKDGLKEVKDAQKSGKKLQTLKGFLSERADVDNISDKELKELIKNFKAN